jgi:O-antigen ligase
MLEAVARAAEIPPRVVRVHGALAMVGRVFLLATIPLSLIWLPVGRIPGAGNLAAGDVAQIGLWVVTLAALFLHGRFDVGLRAPMVAVLGLALASLAGIAGQFSGVRDAAGLEFMLLMKRFVLSAIVPLSAVLFGSPAMCRWTRALTALMVGVLVALTLDPSLQAWLPRPGDYDADIFASEQRATGSVTNPNDLAYAAAALFILHAAFSPRRPGAVDRALLLAVLSGSLTCIVSSGSRSGVIGVTGAVVFLVLTSAVPPTKKMGLLLAASIAAGAGLTYSTVLQQRITSAYSEGVREKNISSRLDGQWLAMRVAVVHPFGVGYGGISRATSRESSILEYGTSDSVYLDTLLGAGFLGLFCLLALFWTGWRHIGRSRPPGDLRAHLLKSGVVAFLLFGTATVVPISVFLSPLFFNIVGAAAYPDEHDR